MALTLESLLSYVYYRYQYTYYELLLYKYQLWEQWRQLSRVSRCIYCCSVCFGTAFAGWLLYRFVERKRIGAVGGIDDVDDVVVRSKRRKKGIPPGLFNDGNTCFLNCVLQALASCPSLYKWTTDVLTTHGFTNVTLFPSIHKLLKVLSNVTGNESVYSASDVVASFHAHGWVISHEQQDAYEFLQVLTSTMEEELVKMNDGNIPSNTLLDVALNPTFTSSICSKVSKHLPTLFGNKHLVSPMKGSYASKLSCITCGNQLAVKFETFDSLILNLNNISPLSATLYSCLKEWIKPELLHQVECQTCDSKYGRKYSTFSKQVSLAKLPSCLCIQLQRTTYSNFDTPQKNQMFVQFPELVDVYPYTYGNILSQRQQFDKKRKTSKDEVCPLRGGSTACPTKISPPACQMLYQLSSVIVHLGGADGGHFITCRKVVAHDGTVRWFHISDAYVQVVPKEQVLRSTAYLLFYEKV